MPFETYALYLVAVAVFFATPPDTSQLLIISNSLQHGLRRNLWTIAGDLSANALQMTAAAFGLTAIIATSATAFIWIKWAGVAYLLWIGISLMRNRNTGPVPAAAQKASRLYRQGFFTSMANPFAVVFFAALFPQFIAPTLPILPQLVILGVTYLVVDGAILLLWGWCATRAMGLMKTAPLNRINRICGALMIAAAGLLAAKDGAPEQAR